MVVFLALFAIAFELIAPFLEEANYTGDAIAWSEKHIVYVYDSDLQYGEGYCDCEPDPKIVHIAALSLDLYRAQHETQHAWDWNDYDAVERLADTRILALRDDLVGDLARKAVARALPPYNEIEHLNTHIIEGLGYRVGVVPEWYRVKHMSSRKPVYRVSMPLVDRTRSN